VSYNPDAPRVIGLQFPATSDATFSLSSAAKVLGIAVPSRSAESIDKVSVHTHSVSASARLTMDVYRLDGAQVALVSNQGYRPANSYGDVPIGATVQAGGWTNNGGGAATVDRIDDGATLDETNWVQATGFTDQAVNPQVNNLQMRLDTKLNGGGGSRYAGRRIAGVRLRAHWIPVGAPGYLFMYLNVQGTRYLHAVDLQGPYNPTLTLQGFAASNPFTGRPWTVSDVERFRDSDSFELGWAGGNSLATVRVFAVEMLVYWADETRLAVGTKNVVGGVHGSQEFDLSTPDYHNRLTANQASVETDTTGLAAITNCSISRVTAVAGADGSAELQMQATAGGDMVAGIGNTTTEGVRVVPGLTYAFAASFRTAVTARSCRVSAQWFDGNGVLISTSTGSSVVDASGSWTQASLVVAAPVEARYVRMRFEVLAAAASEIHYVDAMMLTPESVPASFVAGGGSRTFLEKANGQTYVFAVRRQSGSGVAAVAQLDSGKRSPHQVESYQPTLLALGGQVDAGAFSALGPVLTASPGIILTTTAPATSTDSQPYVDARLAEDVAYSGNEPEQEITPAASGDYALLSAWVAQQVSSLTGASLTVNVRRRSDNALMGTVTIAPADLVAPRTTVQRVTKTFATPIALVGGTQYYVEYVTTGASGVGWKVLVLDSMGLGNGAGFGGTADAFTNVATGGESQDRDAVVTLDLAPAAPTGFDANLVQVVPS